ncbi:helix-turn-helix domain-containing protein [Roseivirga sp.]|uniref:AraC family transcriptional regulator n=1 Tax=Roseivirga sp. TaxID=1964215 RepID=UPI003B8CD79D
MRLDRFPDIKWIQNQSKTNFQNGKDVNSKPLQASGWPSVVLNTHSFGAERNDIKGPFSLFLNVSGSSHVKVNGKSVKITDDNLCMTNQGDFYDLTIPEGESTETFNIHFGEQLFNDVVNTNQSSSKSLLDRPLSTQKANFELGLHSIWRDELINHKINQLRFFYQQNTPSVDAEYDLLSNLLATMLEQQSMVLKAPKSLSAIKKSTQSELIDRVGLSVDYIHAFYRETINLDTLAAIACLSKFHYLRTFKSVYRCTPQQMVANLRFKKAKSELLNSTKSIIEIAPSLGFSEIASFTRFFSKHAGMSPKTYRQNN